MIDLFSKNEKTPAQLAASVFFAFLFLPVALLAQAFTVSWLWEWYVVSHFHVASLPLIIAWGVSYLIRFVTSNFENNSKILDIHNKLNLNKHEYGVGMFTNIVVSLWFLLFGWLGTFFM